MRIIPKPIKLIERPHLKMSALEVLVTLPQIPKERVVARAYQQLVTGQGVHPDRAKQLLGLPEK